MWETVEIRNQRVDKIVKKVTKIGDRDREKIKGNLEMKKKPITLAPRRFTVRNESTPQKTTREKPIKKP